MLKRLWSLGDAFGATKLPFGRANCAFVIEESGGPPLSPPPGGARRFLLQRSDPDLHFHLAMQ